MLKNWLAMISQTTKFLCLLKPQTSKNQCYSVPAARCLSSLDKMIGQMKALFIQTLSSWPKKENNKTLKGPLTINAKKYL